MDTTSDLIIYRRFVLKNVKYSKSVCSASTRLEPLATHLETKAFFDGLAATANGACICTLQLRRE